MEIYTEYLDRHTKEYLLNTSRKVSILVEGIGDTIPSLRKKLYHFFRNLLESVVGSP